MDMYKNNFLTQKISKISFYRIKNTFCNIVYIRKNCRSANVTTRGPSLNICLYIYIAYIFTKK